MVADARSRRRHRLLSDLRTVARALAVSLALVAVLTLVLVVGPGWPVRDSAALSLLVVAGLAPFAVSSGVNQVMDLGIDALTGRPRGSQTDEEPPSELGPGGVFLFVSIPLGALGLYLG